MQGILNLNLSLSAATYECMTMDMDSVPDAAIGVFICVLHSFHSQNHSAYQNWVKYANSTVCPYFLLDRRLPT